MMACDEHGSAPMIWNPVLNRGTNWSLVERDLKSLRGLLPPVQESLDLQTERVMSQIRDQERPIDK